MEKKRIFLFIFLFNIYAMSADTLTAPLPQIIEAHDTSDTIITTEVDTSTDSLFSRLSNLIRESDSLNQTDSIERTVILTKLEKFQNRQSKQVESLQMRIKELVRDDSIRKNKKAIEITKIRKKIKKFPIFLKGDTLFYILMNFGAFSSEERATSINQKIRILGRNNTFFPDSLRIQQNETGSDILYTDMVIMTVTENDALLLTKSQDELAEEYLTSIRNALINYRKSQLPFLLLRQFMVVFFAILIISGLILTIRYILNVAQRMYTNKKDTYIHAIRIGQAEIVSKRKVESAIIIVFIFFQIALYSVALYISSSFIFDLFPNTKQYSDIVYDKLFIPIYTQGVNFISNYLLLLTLSIIGLVLIHWIMRLLKKIVSEIKTGNLRLQFINYQTSLFIYYLFAVSMYLFFIFWFLLMVSKVPYAFLLSTLVILIFCFIIFFSFIQSALHCALLHMRKPFKIGDIITLNGISGKVSALSFWQTSVLQPDQSISLVHNASIHQEFIHKHYSENQAANTCVFSLFTDSTIPLEQIQHSARTSAELTHEMLHGKNIHTYFTAIDKKQAHYTIITSIESTDNYYEICSTYMHNLKVTCEKNHIPVLTMKQIGIHIAHR